jgi:transposase
MEVLYPRCAGLDVHKATVVAGVRLAAPGGEAAREVRTFGTTTAGLLELAAWLAARGCTHVAIEATGAYWKPVWHVLAEGGFALVLANAAQVRNVPGRKTDVGDATWLAELLAHGLVRASFVPDAPTQELRALLRTRKQLVREKASHTQRLQKTLEDANIKLDAVLADLLGTSGRAMLEALVAGESDPAKLAALAHPRLAATPERLREALRGRVTRHHRFLLRLHLDQVDALDAAAGRVDLKVEEHLAPFRAAVDLLTSIPGVGARGPGDRGRDRPRHGPLRDRRSPRLLGRAVPEERRERRQAPLHPPTQGRALAEDHPRPVRLGGQPQEGQLSASPVPPPARPSRTEEGGVRGGGLDPDRRLPHAEGRHRLPGPRPRPLRPPRQGGAGPAARPPPRRPRLRRRAGASRASTRVSPVSS